MFNLHKIGQSPNLNQLVLPYHLKKGDWLTSGSQEHFVKSFASIADRLNSVQQPPQDVWLSGEIVLCGSAA